MTCENCGQFFEPGQNSDMIQGGCPGCGQPLRDRQPGDVGIETQLQQNMPAPGEEDMGGNPLKEGILADGGWQNRQKRDESFASVQSSWNDSLKPKVAWDAPDAGPWPEQEGTPIDPALEDSLKQRGIAQGEGQICTNCGGLGCYRCLGTGSEPMGGKLTENPDSPLMDQVRQVGPYHGHTLSQRIYPALYSNDDPDFEIEDVETPDPKSVKDKELKKVIKEFEKEAGFWGGLWNGVKDVGQYAWRHPLEAGALAAGAVATGGAALPEEAALVGGEAAAAGAGAAGAEAAGVGAEAAGAGGEAAALGSGNGAGIANGAAAAVPNAGIANGVPAAVPNAENAAGWMRNALQSGWGAAKKAPGAVVKAEGTSDLINQGTGMMTGGGGGSAPQGGGMDPRSIQQITHVKVADDYETPTSHDEIPKNRDGDSNVKTDGDNTSWQKDYEQGDEGGASMGSDSAMSVAFSPETDAAYEMMFPLVHHFHMSEEDGSLHPLLQALHQMMEADKPGYLQLAGDSDHESMPHDPLQADPTMDNHKEDNTDATDSQIKQTNIINAPGAGVPTAQPVPQLPGAGPNQSRCINGHVCDPSSKQCPQCGAPVPSNPGVNAQNLVQPELQAQAALGDPTPPVSPYIESPDIPEGMGLQDYRRQRNMKGVFEQCPNCGMKNMMGDPICRGCQMSLDNTRTASDHQGPHTPEQMAAVSQLLQQQGRGDEVPNMILQPWDYADELAQIQHNPDVPDGEQQTTPAPPPQPDPNSSGMPVPGMDVGGPGAGPGAPPTMSHVAADSVARKCPKCESHTTGIVSQEDGTSVCHSCGHIFKSPNMITDDGRSTDLSTTARMYRALQERDNFQGVPAADQKHQEDPNREQDSTLTWKDEDGQPLKVGQQYKMKSAQYSIPDIVRVENVRPDSIEYTIVGEYGIAGNTKVSFLEAKQDGLTFQPFGSDPSQENSFDIEHNDDDATQREEAGFETSDLSTPHQLVGVSKVIGDHGEYETNPQLDWLREEGDFLRTAGARFTPTEQREFIEESGEARNRDKLQLAGTHYESSVDEDYFLFGL